LAVVSDDEDVRARFTDAAHLAPPVDLESYVTEYLNKHDEPSRAAVYAAYALASGMLHADGITVIRQDGALLAYNAFVRQLPERATSGAGGARRRTYEALAQQVGTGLRAIFYRSQDGASAITTASP
jgi:hypothetical protein